MSPDKLHDCVGVGRHTRNSRPSLWMIKLQYMPIAFIAVYIDSLVMISIERSEINKKRALEI